MIIQLKTQLHTLDGKPLTQPKQRVEEGIVVGQDEEDVILENLIKGALLQGNEKDTADEKVEKFELTLRISTAGDEIDLESEDIAMIKKLVGKIYAPLVVGQVFRLLEGKPTGLDGKKETSEV